MGFIGRHTQDEASSTVILFDKPGGRNRNGRRTQLGGGATACEVRDAKARILVSPVVVTGGNPGAHGETEGSATDERQEPQRGRPFVVRGDLGQQVDPTISGIGQLLHARNDLRGLFSAELHSLDLAYLASHAMSIAVVYGPLRPGSPQLRCQESRLSPETEPSLGWAFCADDSAEDRLVNRPLRA